MIKYYVPYLEGSPLAIDIKGHRMLILATEEAELYNDIDLIGCNEIREIIGACEESEFLADLAVAIEGGVIVLPPGEGVAHVVETLHEELPWVH